MRFFENKVMTGFVKVYVDVFRVSADCNYHIQISL